MKNVIGVVQQKKEKIMTTAIVDIETNGLKEAVIKNGQITIPKATKIHCIVAKCYDTGRIKTWVQDECKQFAEWSKLIDTFIMHNGLYSALDRDWETIQCILVAFGIVI